MIIQNHETGNTGKIYVQENGTQLALLEYILDEKNRLVIQHTEVDERLQGKKVGEALVENAVAIARERGLKIFPACSFAAMVFRKNTSYQDVL